MERIFPENAVVVEESRWSRIYAIGSGPAIYASKFVTDDISVSWEAFESEWAKWPESERLEFAKAYGFKSTISAEDQRILTLLMDKGNPQIWDFVANLFPKLPDANRVLAFLSSALSSASAEPKTNMICAVEKIGGTDAVATLLGFYRVVSGLASPSGSGSWHVIDFLTCSSSLAKLLQDDQYLLPVRKYISDSRILVRLFAQRILRDHGELRTEYKP